MNHTCPGLRIQPNWDEVFCEDNSTIWFHEYTQNDTQSHKLRIQGSSLVPDPDANNFEYARLSEKVLKVYSPQHNISRTFQSPDLTVTSSYSELRQPTAHLTCMDIGPNGDLALSAASDKTVYLWEPATGHIRRTLEGHLGEVYTCRFFPSGLAALTAGADMQLKIWCLVTGNCATTLAPGAAGGQTRRGCLAESEPGGHRSGIIDTGIIHRGRNIVAIDRLGWLRLWDVSCQVCISGIPLVSRAGKLTRQLCPVIEEACCLTVKKQEQPGSPFPKFMDVADQTTWYQVLETSSPKVCEVGTNDALVAVGMGTEGAVQLYELRARARGCVARFSLPHATGSVEACAFPHSVLEPPSNSEAALHAPAQRDTSAFMEYGLYAGGQNGELACWDLRQSREPLFTLNGEKGAVVQLEAYESVGCRQVVLFVGRSDGRVMVHAYDPAQNGDTSRSRGKLTRYTDSDHLWRNTLELTGINCEPVRGMRVRVSGEGQTVSVWTASLSGVFRTYQQLATSLAFP